MWCSFNQLHRIPAIWPQIQNHWPRKPWDTKFLRNLFEAERTNYPSNWSSTTKDKITLHYSLYQITKSPQASSGSIPLHCTRATSQWPYPHSRSAHAPTPPRPKITTSLAPDTTPRRPTDQSPATFQPRNANESPALTTLGKLASTPLRGWRWRWQRSSIATSRAVETIYISRARPKTHHGVTGWCRCRALTNTRFVWSCIGF